MNVTVYRSQGSITATAAIRMLSLFSAALDRAGVVRDLTENGKAGTKGANG